jgi:hypothetical protein
MRPGAALRLALRDLYAQSWRLVLVNGALGLALVVTLLLAAANPVALVLVPLTGPLAAALVHCAVTLVRTGELRLGDAFAGLQANWRRGLGLGAALVALVAVGVTAIRFYADRPASWPLAFLTLYLLAAVLLFTVLVWTLAVAEPAAPLRVAAGRAAELAATRPGGTLLIGFLLLLVNAAGIAAALMPFLTLTLAFTFLAAARFALPAEDD